MGMEKSFEEDYLPKALKILSLVFISLAAITGVVYLGLGSYYYLRGFIGQDPLSLTGFIVLGTVFVLTSAFALVLLAKKDRTFAFWSFFLTSLFAIAFLFVIALLVIALPETGGYYEPLMLSLIACAGLGVIVSSLLPLFKIIHKSVSLVAFFFAYFFETSLWCALFVFSFYLYGEAPVIFLLFLGLILERSAEFLAMSLLLPDWVKL
jgi:hypothetical protein